MILSWCLLSCYLCLLSPATTQKAETLTLESQLWEPWPFLVISLWSPTHLAFYHEYAWKNNWVIESSSIGSSDFTVQTSSESQPPFLSVSVSGRKVHLVNSPAFEFRGLQFLSQFQECRQNLCKQPLLCIELAVERIRLMRHWIKRLSQAKTLSFPQALSFS